MLNQNLTYFPKYLSRKAIVFYLISLLSVSILYVQYALPWWLMLFGIISVLVFFHYSSLLSKEWQIFSSKGFEKKVFWTAFLIRLVYVIFIYNLNYELYGTYYESNEGDINWYVPTAEYFAQSFFENSLTLKTFQNNLTSLSDCGYIIYLFIVYILTFNISTVIVPLIIKSFFGAITCILIYKISYRHFGDKTARIAGIFCMLQFNMIWWCGSMMKETEMVFVTCAFINYFDRIIYENKFSLKRILIGLLLGGVIFTFRTALGLCAFGAVFLSIILTPSRLVGKNKKIFISVVVFSSLLLVGGNKIIDDVTETIDTINSSHQEINMNWRAHREHGNEFAKYAGAAVFAPLIFSIPFPSMVYTYQSQEMQMQVNGGNYIKNVLSFFVIYAMLYLIFTKKWREYVFIVSFMMAYLAALVFSEFAQSGRFHMPVIPFEMMFAAYGLSVISKKHLAFFNYFLFFELFLCIGWAWFKLAGRGWI